MNARSAAGTVNWTPWILLGLGLLFGVEQVLEAVQIRSVGSAIKGLGIVVLGISIFLLPPDMFGDTRDFMRRRHEFGLRLAVLSILAWVFLFVGIGLRWTE